MASPLIPLHALVGSLGALFYLWVFIELLRPVKVGEPAFGRIHIASALGALSILLSWAMGGYYYVSTYGPEVKPLVLGVSPWVHNVLTETKEHIFLFMSFLAILATALIRVYGRDLEKVRGILLLLAASIFLIGTIVAAEGYVISNTARTALEALK